MKLVNTLVVSLKLHLKYMYRKGFFPYIPSPKCSYECFALFTCCASRYAPARSIAFGSFPVFARC
nr:MAG TPA: Lines C-terminus [Bacteriophage sp.]